MKSLRHFLQNELYNLFHSKSFLFVLLILLLIVTADDILAYKSYKDNLQPVAKILKVWHQYNRLQLDQYLQL